MWTIKNNLNHGSQSTARGVFNPGPSEHEEALITRQQHSGPYLVTGIIYITSLMRTELRTQHVKPQAGTGSWYSSIRKR
jgi:hypothetical protein